MKYLKRLWFTILALIVTPIACTYEVLFDIWTGDNDKFPWNPFRKI